MTADVKDNETHVDIDWYRVPVDKEILRELNTRSDIKGLAQSLGHLALVVLTGGLAIYGVGRFPWWGVVAIVFIHGTIFSFLLSGFHELCHGTVFQRKWLNDRMLQVYSLISLFHYVEFQESHKRHHRYTLHAPYDSEVVLPITYAFWSLMKGLFVDLRVYRILIMHWRYATGHIDNPWARTLFPESKPALRRKLFNWSRFTLAVHACVALASIALAIAVHPRWLLLPILTTFGRGYGRLLNFLLNDTQHVGLRDNIPDFRLCCRSVKVNPFFGFLHWQMQYHIEHHMYAAVPCYNLPKLNCAIRDQLPEPPKGVWAAWRQIAAILKRQKTEPDYCYLAKLPADGHANPIRKTAET